jgi:DNA polymerase III subunit delta
MAKSKSSVPPIAEALSNIKKNLLPVYYFFGEDELGIEKAVADIEKFTAPLLTSDFDKEIIRAEGRTLPDILSLASTFPFGSEKKLIIVKDLDKIKDKKALLSYIQSPPDFTILILWHPGSPSNISTEPFKTLLNKNFLFEAKELKGEYLIKWLINEAAAKGKTLNKDNAQLLVSITGENRSNLEDQLEKIVIFMGDTNEITFDAVKALSTALKEYTIFDLTGAIGRKDKKEAFRIAFKLLDSGMEPLLIIAMLNKFIMSLARISEFNEQKLPDAEAARIVQTHPYYYAKDYKSAKQNFTDFQLINASNALFNADLAIKSTAADEKNIMAILLAEILK